MTRIGDAITRPEGRDKVSGRTRYTADRRLPGMLHAVYVPAAIAAGRVNVVDAQPALAHRGVIRVLTHADMPRLKVEQSPPAASKFLPMQSDEVRHQGQPVAIVLAETLQAAEHGARLVKVAYARQAATMPDEGHGVPARARPPAKDSGYLLGETDFRTGDAEAAMAAAAHRVEQRYLQPSRHNNPMEPSATLAAWDGDRLTLYDTVQHGYSAQGVVAGAFGLKADAVRVICPNLGGGFGAKGYVWPHQILAAAAARVARRPVKLVLSRADMYANVGYQPRIVHSVALGSDAQGRLQGLVHDVVNVTSVSDDFTEFATEASKSMYACPAIHTTQRVEASNVNLPTAMRAPVEGPGTWAMGSAMDELARQLGVDPLDLMLRNHADTDPKDGRPFSSKKLREAYAVGAERFGWRRRGSRPKVEGHWRVGFGVADCTMGTFRMASKAEVRLKADGTASVDAGYHDIGSGASTVMPQIAADVLGLPITRVGTRYGDTALPAAGPTYGSSSTLSGGSAVMLAAEDVRAQLARLAGIAPERAVMRNGRIGLADVGGRTIAEVMRAGGVRELVGNGDWSPNGLPFEADGGKGPFAMKTFGVIFVEVGVDADLGLLRLRRAVGAYSAGRIVNPRTARAQMTGGIIWGWGMAAMEASRHEAKLGRWEAKNLSNVALPVNADIPGSAIDVVFVDEVDPHASPLGAKGIGELGATGVAAAVANAVFDATGQRVRELPITPEKLLQVPSGVS